MIDFRRAMASIFLFGAALLSLTAHAQKTDEEMCRNGGFPREQESLQIAKVAGTAQERLYFFDDHDGCPGKGDECRTNAYVLPGDEILLGKVSGNWTCAWYQGKKQETVGWIPNKNLVIQGPPVSAPDWVGTWKQHGPGYISIARKGGVHYVQANMRWIGGQLPDGSHNEHFGGMEGELRIDKHRARLGGQGDPAGWDCTAQFTRVGRFLVVHDNAQCGGLNVRFDGVYTRSARRSSK